MRDIEFRGKVKGEDKLVWGYYRKGIVHFIYENDAVTFHEVIPETVGQYIGLRDLNQKKIFEGDIAKNEWGKKGVVFWFADHASFYWGCGGVVDSMVHYEELEVIGNIYDNPELLEEANNG